AAPARPISPAVPSVPSNNPAVPSRPAPSTAISSLQRQLGDLNYYDGPINGIMTPQTVQAIGYLQRDAKLPVTGTLDAATSTALNAQLIHGNNQMAG
ncbi:MAG: Peptidoglycan-binding domain 1 protein, partial [Pseudonocardiales bacterium]|nr:Peptidoglycan-binding domain 1 protein [Pseudonocardiales bacterium]